jgi:hypothetical protein
MHSPRIENFTSADLDTIDLQQPWPMVLSSKVTTIPEQSSPIVRGKEVATGHDDTKCRKPLEDFQILDFAETILAENNNSNNNNQK